MTRRTDLDLDLEERQRLLDAWVDKRRRIAALEAEASELLIERISIHDADVTESPFHRDAIYRSMLSEYCAAAHLARGTVEQSFTDARTLSRDLPHVRVAFAAGTISVAHVREIVRASAIVSEAVRSGRADAATLALFETAVLVVAEQDTAARTRAHARQVAAALAGETVVERHRRATDERCVSVRSVDDGLALLTAVLPEWIAVAIADRLTRLARTVVTGRDDREPVLPVLDPAGDGISVDDLATDDPRRDSYERSVIFGEGNTFTTDPLGRRTDPMTDPTSADVEHLEADERTLDQIRADLLADLLLAAVPSEALGTGLDAVQPRIQVTVAATTLVGLDDRPAELDGYGPLDPDIARRLAGRNTGWSRLFLHPDGRVVEVDTYAPNEAMRRFLRARDQHCRFPGCRMPVHRCEIDHNHDHARGGRTRLDNLSHFCTTHHSLKHPDVDDRHRWTAQQGPGGEVTWTSPLGREYTDPPRRRVMFV
ncbi:HNH endonuclease signature motif containing protein [Microbacterium sp. 1.5R]|uniref:HNH endonuclease signature motif containing protein n=1 Tax=Microbacterium sp. 1.5R TaxID=1916917 RepID=UPI0011A8E042|nr:HNH endonuclease signature motif containing protein [Microbacterium sp. 1.5R]